MTVHVLVWGSGCASIKASPRSSLGFTSLTPAGVFDSIMYTPFVRELCFLHGWCGVDRLTLLARLRQGPGSAVGIYVGGAAEAVYAEVRSGWQAQAEIHWIATGLACECSSSDGEHSIPGQNTVCPALFRSPLCSPARLTLCCCGARGLSKLRLRGAHPWCLCWALERTTSTIALRCCEAALSTACRW